MATFDVLIDDLASRFGLGANSRVLVREVLAMIAGTPGVSQITRSATPAPTVQLIRVATGDMCEGPRGPGPRR